MHKLHRGEAPSCLDRHNHTSGNDWKKVSREDKTEIWKALNAMQFDRCAYCESKIIDPKKHIEHFFPRGGFPKLTFTWSNIFGSCDNQDHCGKYKDNGPHGKYYVPTDLIKPDEEESGELLLFVVDGTVAPRHNLSLDEQRRGEETIRVFNLNAASLKNQRRQAVQGYLKLAEGQSELSEADWKEYISDELRAVTLHAFVTAIQHTLTEPDAQSSFI